LHVSASSVAAAPGWLYNRQRLPPLTTTSARAWSCIANRGRPIALMAHPDVVIAKREDWVRDPFTPVEENGYFFGRGTLDLARNHRAPIDAGATSQI